MQRAKAQKITNQPFSVQSPAGQVIVQGNLDATACIISSHAGLYGYTAQHQVRNCDLLSEQSHNNAVLEYVHMGYFQPVTKHVVLAHNMSQQNIIKSPQERTQNSLHTTLQKVSSIQIFLTRLLVPMQLLNFMQ